MPTPEPPPFQGSVFQDCTFAWSGRAAVAGSGFKAQFNNSRFIDNPTTFEVTDSEIELNDCTIE